MQDSICPKGWGLPINGDAQTTKSWINLLFTSYSLQDNGDSSTNAHKTPLSLVYSGNYYWVDGNLYSRGSYGDFWSSTPSSAASAHLLLFDPTRLVPQGGGNKIYGFTIRCVGQFSPNLRLASICSANFIKFANTCKTPFVQKDGDYQLMVMHKQQKAGLTYYLQVIVYKTMTLLLLLMLIKLLFPLSTPATTTG
ncbi:hypothetical protein IKF81_01695 [Candidatus Saccharibacteria bacterium]|nr:hypothetical protein [Candidatus Saccharibacteria bacterium]